MGYAVDSTSTNVPADAVTMHTVASERTLPESASF